MRVLLDDLLEEKVRDEDCTACKLHRDCEEVCQMGHGPKAKIMVVSRMPNSGKYQADLEAELQEAGFDTSEMFFTAALKCRTFESSPSATDVKACRHYLETEVKAVKPEWILTLGNEALQSVTGNSGIMKYRGIPQTKIFGGREVKIFPTISPAAVVRNPGQRPGFVADLLLFLAKVNGVESSIGKPRYLRVDTKAKIKRLIGWLDEAELIAYDIETTGRSEFDLLGRIVSLSGTLLMPDGKLKVFALPLYHPESVWQGQWRGLLKLLAPHLERIPKQTAHNGKFDARWMRRFGVWMRVTFDTILACHLLDENRQKGLKPQAASRLGVAPWGIDTRDLLNEPLDKILDYNVLDSWYQYHIYVQLKQELIEQPRLLRIFKLILMPANEELIVAEGRGLWMDRQKLDERTKIAYDMLADKDEALMKFVPHGEHWVDHQQELAEIGWPVKRRLKSGVVRLSEPNFNASNFARWLLFDYYQLPVLERGKSKDDGSPGMPSMKEAVLLELKTVHPVVQGLLDRSMWQKYTSSFFDAYQELIDDEDKVHTSFKLFGTVTGRTSSGKEDPDKITASRDRGRGANLQQVPRDVFVRGLFGAPPGRLLVEVDFSQVELRVVAFLSRDRTMLRLYQTGQDIHMATAQWVLGMPASQISKEERKKAKAINFGFVYGMGAPKFVTTAFEKYELHFTLDEAKAIRTEFFKRFAGLFPWHARMRRLAHEHARVQSPIGRIRHLPDIRSQDKMVVAEAERQAINSPVQAFASDLNLLGMVETVRLFKERGIDAHAVGNVHDATLWDVAEKDAAKAIRLIKWQYENLPLKRKFGIHVDVPIVADIKAGRYWSEGAVELTEEQALNFKMSMLT